MVDFFRYCCIPRLDAAGRGVRLGVVAALAATARHRVTEVAVAVAVARLTTGPRLARTAERPDHALPAQRTAGVVEAVEADRAVGGRALGRQPVQVGQGGVIVPANEY